MTENIPTPKETDHLRYKGNDIPRMVRLWWTVVIVFSIFYLILYMVPDLKVWIDKIK